MNKYNKSIKIGIAVIVIIIFYILYNIDWSDEYLISERIIFNYADTSKDVVNNLLVSIITGLITILAVILTIEHTNVINNENKKIEKEIQYRAMNKQNSDVILSEIKKFYGNACYMNELINIEKLYDVKGLFSSEYKNLDSINKVFLKKIKDDFFYDETIEETIGKLEIVECGSTDYFVKCKQLFETFYGFSDDGNMRINFNKYNENARLKFYEKLLFAEGWGYDKLRQKVTFSLNDMPLFMMFMKIQKDKQTLILDKCSTVYKILNIVPKTSTEFKQIMNDKGSTLCKEYEELKEIYTEVFPSKKECELEIFYIYKAQFQQVSGIMPYNAYGQNNEKYIKCYLDAFKLISNENIDMFNVSYQKIEKYNYL